MVRTIVFIGFLSMLFGACTLRPVQTQHQNLSQNLTAGTNKLSLPIFNLADGTYPVPATLLITSNDGATIHCTTDGSTPTCSSNVCSSPINYASPTTVDYKAIACKTGTAWLPSDISVASYTFINSTPLPTVDTPVFSVPSGTYATTQSVNITTTTGGAIVHYTTDGSSPSCSSASSLPISISSTTTVKAIACKTGWTISNMATAIYTITGTLAAPIFSPAAGTYATSQSVTISAQTGAEIHYTTGSTPVTCSSPQYNAAIPVTVTTTINAIACLAAWNSSSTASATYIIT
ncbi:MAG: chitobiase/beta-hexosaminidase C-terminal domain-containing protein, partial [bacterium]